MHRSCAGIVACIALTLLGGVAHAGGVTTQAAFAAVPKPTGILLIGALAAWFGLGLALRRKLRG